VIGTTDARVFDLLKNMYPRDTKVICTSNASAELGKLMSNALLAQRISSINSISCLAEKFQDCSLEEVR